MRKKYSLPVYAPESGATKGLLGETLGKSLSRRTINRQLRVSSRTRPRTCRALCRALEAIHTEPAEPWTVEGLARIAGISRTVFATRFNALVADPPLAYLTDWRMQLARRLLLECYLPIIDVAERTGYKSEASFGRVFKRHFNAPSAGFQRAGGKSAVT
jgi:transcriptional regulator GlxA family with amidase domain